MHGGAGGLQDHRIDVANAGTRRAVEAGLRVFGQNGSAVDAVQAAVRVLEDDPEFNAGVGAALTRDGTVEVDAAIMDGGSLRIGAIAAVENLRRPIDLARLVLNDGEHVLLVAHGAWLFAQEHGIVPVELRELLTDRSLAILEQERLRRAPVHVGGGTVGACAIDARGHVAAATSTGGTPFKRRGRVGDTPLSGCGTYADDQGGAASATGHGESIIRVTLTRRLVDMLRAGAPAEEAARGAIDELGQRVDGSGGVICVDRNGRVGVAHNTPRMPFAKGSLGDPIMADVAV